MVHYSPLKVLVSGSSGFIGKALCEYLEERGCLVTCLVRKRGGGSSCVLWNPVTKEVNIEELEGFDAVIHLAGESIFKGLWTSSRKKKILKSRQDGTEYLASLLIKLKSPPSVFIGASAVGYYGNGFLSEVCHLWESASLSLENKGIRRVIARLGVVISSKGGILKNLLPLFRLGLGAKLGSGKQLISWISLDDVLGSFYHILTQEALKGPINIVSPSPVSQENFAKILAKVLSKPCFISIPSFLLIGEQVKELVLSSVKVFPKELQSAGYLFSYPQIEEALQSSLFKRDDERLKNSNC